MTAPETAAKRGRAGFLTAAIPFGIVLYLLHLFDMVSAAGITIAAMVYLAYVGAEVAGRAEDAALAASREVRAQAAALAQAVKAAEESRAECVAAREDIATATRLHAETLLEIRTEMTAVRKRLAELHALALSTEDYVRK